MWGKNTNKAKNSLMSAFYSLTLLLRKIHLGTLRHVIIQTKEIICCTLLWLRYTVQRACIGQHCFFNSHPGRGLRPVQCLWGSHFYQAEKGWWHLLIAAASFEDTGRKMCLKTQRGQIENGIQRGYISPRAKTPGVNECRIFRDCLLE